MATKTKSRKSQQPKARYIGKPAGTIQDRVQVVGPEHFGVIAVDCAKRRSKWMLCDFYGKVIIEPTIVEHNSGALKVMINFVTEKLRSERITDSIVAIEMTGVYHRPVQRAFRQARFDTRTVHPFASKHFRSPLHPNSKTDDLDLEAIFHAAIKGYGLATLPVDETYRALQATSRHRRNLVKQRSRLQIQMRCLLHQTMPGYADLFEDDKLFNKSIALPIALGFPSAEQIRLAGVEKIAAYLRENKIRFQPRTIERIVAWSATAIEPAPLFEILSEQWKQLNDLRMMLCSQIVAVEQEMAKFLVKTPYVLLMSVMGINVVSAAGFAGEAGPIEHYATARAITGRAGIFPTRYQSDEVDRADGAVARNCNRRLRAASILIAKNLMKCHPYYRGLAALMASQKVTPLDRQCRIANRAMRMVFQIVGGRQVWRGKGINQEYILEKLQEFHRVHSTPIDKVIQQMHEIVQWLPKSTYASEAKPIQEFASKKHRGPILIGDLMIPLLIRLGVVAPEEVQLDSSEARGSD
jgi:transposase